MFNSAYKISPTFLHQIDGFGAANLTMQAKCVSPTAVAMVTKICKFAHYIFLADRTNGWAYATVLRPSSSVCRL